MRHLTLTVQIIILAVIIGVLAYAIHRSSYSIAASPTNSSEQVAASTQASATSTRTTTTATASSTATTTKPVVKKAPIIKQTSPAAAAPTASTTKPSGEIVRIENPYSTQPESFSTINTRARGALVNIFCSPKGGSLRPISGSGTIIDSRGVILTNAHVAQYVLLSESPRVNLSCFIRTGSPASSKWIPKVLYIPATWVRDHAADISAEHPLGTGEHDYALLYITDSTDSTPLPATFPAIPVDTREAIGFLNDQVLAASYPAEFTGASANYDLYPASSVTNIAQLLTFTTKSVDVISVGSVIEAQSGSSGGSIVNAWGRLIGVITTTSTGATTADRDLRGITLSYINRDIAAQTGSTLLNYLNGDLAAKTAAFTANDAPALYNLIIDQIAR
ncbi:MAG: hypothetical protein JWM46_587 [Candidatus Kaiserbacteria bacterium]|nr:hypothetical protein [Candidatus Kaiserbacteria bacterium]